MYLLPFLPFRTIGFAPNATARTVRVILSTWWLVHNQKDYLDKDIVANYPVWVAHYEKDSPAFEGWTWWQFTDRAVVKGVPGEVDLSVMLAD